MKTTAVFEVATLTDAVTKTSRIAPNKGPAFDRSAGIVIDADPNRTPVVIMKATDLEVTLRLEVNHIEFDGDPVVWRLPSRLMQGLMNTFPMTSGATIELVDTGDGFLYMKSGKTKSKLLQITGEYPEFDAFDPQVLVKAPNLAARLAQVAWATDKKGIGVLSGVHMDGQFLYGCNRAFAAMVPCKVPIVEPLTAPLTEVSSIIRNTGEVMVGGSDTKLLLMPDDHTQASCVLFMDPYPAITPLFTQALNTATVEFEFTADRLIGMLDRTLVLMKDERLPTTNIEIGDGYMKMSLSTDAGLVIDELEIIGGVSQPLKVSFNPEGLKSAVMASGRPTIKVKCGPTDRSPWVLSDDNEYQVIMMPIVRPVV